MASTKVIRNKRVLVTLNDDRDKQLAELMAMDYMDGESEAMYIATLISKEYRKRGL